MLGWSASETAEALDGSVAAVNSALQRARARLQELGRPGRLEWSPVKAPSQQERRLVQQYMDAHARADAAAVIELLGADARFSMPPDQLRFEGRPAIAAFFGELFGVDNPGEWRLVPVRANGQPAAANYVRAWGESESGRRLSTCYVSKTASWSRSPRSGPTRSRPSGCRPHCRSCSAGAPSTRAARVMAL